MPHDSLNDKTAQDAETGIKSILEPLKRAALKVYFPETDNHGNPTLSRFFLENGRLPFASDEIKPWKYRGWLIPYLQLAEVLPAVASRYAYVHRTLEAGRLLDEPLPQISFVGEFEPATKAGMKMLQKCLDEVEYASGSWNGMREFCEWLAFALGVVPEPSKLSVKLQEFLYRNFNLEPLVLHPSDYLGQMLCETSHGKKNGFYPTPINICELMSRMTNSRPGNITDKTMDPCVGTGRMLLVASNHSLRLFGQDIDYLCCLITKINLALYAPWFYIPESFFPPDEIRVEKIIEPEPPPPAIEAESCRVEEKKPIENDLSLFEKMRIEKENKKRRKYSTEIDALPLFDLL